MEPTEQELAGMAAQFLQRVQLSGQEVPAFNMVTSWLASLAKEGEPEPQSANN